MQVFLKGFFNFNSKLECIEETFKIKGVDNLTLWVWLTDLAAPGIEILKCTCLFII